MVTRCHIKTVLSSITALRPKRKENAESWPPHKSLCKISTHLHFNPVSTVWQPQVRKTWGWSQAEGASQGHQSTISTIPRTPLRCVLRLPHACQDISHTRNERVWPRQGGGSLSSALYARKSRRLSSRPKVRLRRTAVERSPLGSGITLDFVRIPSIPGLLTSN